MASTQNKQNLTVQIAINLNLMRLEERNEAIDGEHHARLGRVHQAYVALPQSRVFRDGDRVELAARNVDSHVNALFWC